jgi:predicted HTH domain antitoxin
MRSMSINIPEILDLNTAQLSMILAGKLYEEGKLSLGQAAEVANLSKRTFAELLGSYGVSLFNYPAGDLVQDVSNANFYAS